MGNWTWPRCEERVRMNSRECIKFSAPLRGVRLRKPPTASEWERRIAEASEAAFRRGMAEGRQAGEEQLRQLRADFDAKQSGVLESLRRAVPQVIRDCEGALVSLALETARKLVAGLPISAEMIEAAVREAISKAEDSSEFFVHLHPEDLALLRQNSSPLLASVPGGDVVHFHASNEVARGGCLVYTRFGLIDAQRETKMQQIREAIAA